jgi:hypothetical protein
MEIRYREHLYKLLPTDSVAVELGVAEGQFSRDILNWPNIKKLYSIDTWRCLNGQMGDGGFDDAWHESNYQKAVKLLEPFGNRSTIMRCFTVEGSREFSDNSIDFIHLDADHSYEGVLADLNAWYPKVKSGGVISGHDYMMTHYGVERAVTDFTKQRGIQVNVLPENKPEDAGFYFIKP